MTKPILVAVDPRRRDVAPAAFGAMLARILHAPLVVATAYPGDAAVDHAYPEYAQALQRAADRSVEQVAAAVDDHDLQGRTLAVQTVGSPARALHELAESEFAQLLVIGSSTRGPVGRVFPSAVTDRLIQGAPCPVAVAPAGYSVDDAKGLRLVGAAFTDTPDGREALAFAAAIAVAAEARVRVLTVEEPPQPFLSAAVDAGVLDNARRLHDEAAQAALDRGIGTLPRDRSAGGEILFGGASDALASASEGLDLLVCGSRGYGPVRTLLLGGTSHGLVRKARCPVLVVPRGASTPDVGAP
jgi:nucleotide-binding universal stress UspA family protein